MHWEGHLAAQRPQNVQISISLLIAPRAFSKGGLAEYRYRRVALWDTKFFMMAGVILNIGMDLFLSLCATDTGINGQHNDRHIRQPHAGEHGNQ
jgi:hypothetical protein